MVEFAVVLPLFLFCLIAAIDAGLWAVQTSAEVSAVEQARDDRVVRGLEPDVGDRARCASGHGGDLGAAAQRAVRNRHRRAGAPSTRRARARRTARSIARPRPPRCRPRDGPRVVVVCVSEADPPACVAPPPGQAAPYPLGCDDSPMITVRVIGFVASFVPPGFGPGAGGFELPTNISATTHTLRFAP